ncbi:MAG TPA: NUDIX hydrolase [Bacillota bacterium]|jgi:ADP-ribose pyrophosphatase YjhB (NUDIX family)
MAIRNHERRLLAGAIVSSQSGEILMVRLRGVGPGVVPGWTLPCVEAEEWETAAQAAARAARRRAGLVAIPEVLAFAIEWREDGTNGGPVGPAVFMLFVFQAETDGPILDHRRDPEVLEIRWASPEEAAGLITAPALKNAVECWLFTGATAYHQVLAHEARGRQPGGRLA